jgi:membrane-associated protease RseP (regulator of RpoE activity)
VKPPGYTGFKTGKTGGSRQEERSRGVLTQKWQRFSFWIPVFLFLGFCGTICTAAENHFGGVGLQVVPIETGDLAVLNVVKGSPAMEGGLKPGDLIVRVDNFPLKGSDFSEVVSRYLWGKIGTIVTLKYLRPGEVGIHSATLKRVAMNPEAVAPPGVKMISPGEK